MSLFDRLAGHAGKVGNDSAGKLLEGLLTQTEEVLSTFKLVRDYIIFTNKRLILVDVQGVGTKKEIQSIPYRSISRFTIETAGTADIDSEIKLYISSFEFNSLIKIETFSFESFINVSISLTNFFIFHSLNKIVNTIC